MLMKELTKARVNGRQGYPLVRKIVIERHRSLTIANVALRIMSDLLTRKTRLTRTKSVEAFAIP
jgi:hypothetical protein